MGSEERELLSWASLVCEVGLDISHSQYHRHGAYLIHHSDLMGFSKQQQRKLALLVRGHRRGIPRTLIDNDDEQGRLLKLTLLLRIAIVLNHIRGDENLFKYTLKAGDKKLSLSFPKKWLKTHPLTAADFERERIDQIRVGYWLVVD